MTHKPLLALLLVIAVLAIASLSCITVDHEEYLVDAMESQRAGLPTETAEVER